MYTKSQDSETAYCRKCNSLPGVRMMHPLAGTAEVSPDELDAINGITTDLYTVMMIKNRCCCRTSCYGHTGCDFSYASVLFFRPGDRICLNGDTKTKGAGIVTFRKELAAGSEIERNMGEYRFFGYRTDEALHVSECEERTLDRLFGDIKSELGTCIDEYSCGIIGRRICLLLDYCRRFYNRQFIMRTDRNRKILRQTNHIIHDFFAQHGRQHEELPKAQYIAERTDTSAAYLEDLVKEETGLCLGQYAEMKRLDMARDLLMHSHKSDDEIASILHYGSARCFRLFFSRTTGMTTDQCRTSC